MDNQNSSSSNPLLLVITFFALATLFFAARILLFPLRHFLSSTPYEYNLKRTIPSVIFGTGAYSVYAVAFSLHLTSTYMPELRAALEISAIWLSKASFSSYLYFIPRPWLEAPIHILLTGTYAIALTLTITSPHIPAVITALDIFTTLVLLTPLLLVWPKPLYLLLSLIALTTSALSLSWALVHLPILQHMEASLAVILTGTLAWRLQPPPDPRPPPPKRTISPPTAQWPSRDLAGMDFTSLGVLPDRLPSILPSIDSRDPEAHNNHSNAPPVPPMPTLPSDGDGRRMAEIMGWGGSYTDTEKGGETETETEGETPGSEMGGMHWGGGWGGGEGGGGGGGGGWGGVGSLETTETEIGTETDTGTGTNTATCTEATEVARRPGQVPRRTWEDRPGDMGRGRQEEERGRPIRAGGWRGESDDEDEEERGRRDRRGSGVVRL